MKWWNSTTNVALRSSGSRFVLSGQPQSFASFPPSVLPIEGSRVDSLLQLSIGRGTPQAEQWNRVAQLVATTRELRTTVLGCSTSVGCGSADPSPKCDASRGWPRLYHDAVQSDLHAMLPGWAYSVTTRAIAKNAVDPTYFAQCTTSFVDDRTNIVLVEFFTNLFGVFRQGNHTGLDATIEEIRRAAPNAAIVFVVWVKELVSRATLQLRSLIDVVAKRQSVDVVDLPHALLYMARASTRQVRATSWYAKGGNDHHPNGPGHWLMASAAARLVATRLGDAVPARTTLSNAQTIQSVGMYCADCNRLNLVKKQVCYNSADELPLARTPRGTWALVDEGGEKGVAKLGYVSTHVGDAVHLIMAPSLCAAGTGLVRLGYHLSTRPGQGALHLTCTGCVCKALHGILGPVSPFPTVQTDVRLVDARYFSIPGQLNGSLSVTASTNFGLAPLKHAAAHTAACTLRVEHVTSKIPRGERSRVRIDSLAVSTKCPQQNKAV